MCWSLKCAKKIAFLSLPLGKLKPFPTHPGPLVWAFCHLQSEERKRFCALQAYVKTNQVAQVEN